MCVNWRSERNAVVCAIIQMNESNEILCVCSCAVTGRSFIMCECIMDAENWVNYYVLSTVEFIFGQIMNVWIFMFMEIGFLFLFVRSLVNRHRDENYEKRRRSIWHLYRNEMGLCDHFGGVGRDQQYLFKIDDNWLVNQCDVPEFYGKLIGCKMQINWLNFNRNLSISQKRYRRSKSNPKNILRNFPDIVALCIRHTHWKWQKNVQRNYK